ncbi:hypothetical protein EJ03DRAFT_5557 [Teratosphaeria nubilosa]|uniref:Uncharacterized protein n=1 Tax=Teratosphaeria nubilosa TaxID=161662 RepID=A0A6G1LQD3_9PEZI|nr:hypothetical protein EJ03DRAFT_5557 [Teratosphaeria nubilosa]
MRPRPRPGTMERTQSTQQLPRLRLWRHSRRLRQNAQAAGRAATISTVYTTAGAASSTGYNKRSPLQFNARDNAACTITKTETSTGGVAFYDYTVPSTYTSTYAYYTTWTEATVYETKYNGKSYIIETATATTQAVCGPTVNATSPATTSTVTMDARCSPAAMTSAYKGYGLEYKSNTPASGGHYDTTTNDASECCQLCATSWNCAASAFDIRTGQCTLEFPVDPEAGYLNCGEGMLAYYDAGPNSPMSPGAGLYVQAICGNVEFGSAAPDDST